MTRTALLAATLVGTIVFAACGNDSDPSEEGDAAPTSEAAGSGTEVGIEGFEFQPASTTVSAGSTVTWTNRDDAIHSIQDESDLGTEESDDLGEGDTFEITYDQPGEYPYICGIHNYMTGTVVVEG